MSVNIPRPEYPRPQLVRPDWINLNGEWDFHFDFGKSGEERELFIPECFYAEKPLKINVPFCPESRLSGIAHTDYIPAVWYMRSFVLSSAQTGTGKTLIHFGAVDYRSRIWINGESAGEHIGGYSSFSLDITNLVHEGENIIAVYAEDDLRTGKQPFGKQSDRYHSHDCSYTRTTGIWQTVWLEFVPVDYIKSYRVYPDPVNGAARIEVKTNEEKTCGLPVDFTVFYNGKVMGKSSAAVSYGYASSEISLDEVHLWDAGKPELYDITITMGDDRIEGYFGLRSVDIRPDALYLNGRPFFMRTILDQGFNPEGIYTAPSDEFLRRDIELSMEIGFNGARLHQRVFEERTLYWADKLGYVVWGEYANGNFTEDGRGIGYFLPEWMETVERDFNHPSIIGWCPDNESYWEHDIAEICQRTIYSVTKAMDPTRPVIDASGGMHYITDMFDVHEYEQNADRLREKLAPMLEDHDYFHNPIHTPILGTMKYEGQPYWISEYGGTYWNGDIDPDAGGWGYGENPKTEKEFAERYEALTKTLLECPRVCGFCYTQLTDIEQEQNGLYKYDRTKKFSQFVYDRIKAANTSAAAIEAIEKK